MKTNAANVHRKPHPCFLFLMGLLPLLTFSTAATAQFGTYVPNGFFEEFNYPPVQGGLVTTYAHFWRGSSPDVVITTDLPSSGQNVGVWKVALRGGSPGLGGDWTADYAITTPWISVTPGKKYRLSGWLLRGNPADNVYLDFNDGKGASDDDRLIGVNFPDGHAYARSVNVWEYQSVDVQVGSRTTGVQVRCVRDGANKGNAYCDGLMIQPLN
jgi:hypothetical protein